MRDYELVTIWNPDIGEDGAAAGIERLNGVITARGGEVTDTTVWGRRRLAYFIDRHSEGTYVLMQLRLDPARSAEVENQLRLNENVLRHLLVRKES